VKALLEKGADVSAKGATAGIFHCQCAFSSGTSWMGVGCKGQRGCSPLGSW
jgi:hypothetical protein